MGKSKKENETRDRLGRKEVVMKVPSVTFRRKHNHVIGKVIVATKRQKKFQDKSHGRKLKKGKERQ